MGRRHGNRRRVGAALGALGLLALGCADLLGFEDFSRGRGDDGAGGDCNGQCPPAGVCETGDAECKEVGTGSLEARWCDASRTWDRETCDHQCNPRRGECIELKIDATEVTRSAYAAFLADPLVDPSGQPPGCDWNDSFEPADDCKREESYCKESCDDHPQTCVDWCDARAYCESVGKRLCGRIGDGSALTSDEDLADAGVSEWMNACTAGEQFLFGFDDDTSDYDPGTCTYRGKDIGTTYEVGTQTLCRPPATGYDHIYDLSGNVAEWENNCDHDVAEPTAGSTDDCHARGGSFHSERDALRCGKLPYVPPQRRTTEPWIGFRCCDD
jgi:sulfatase modifying factor 1